MELTLNPEFWGPRFWEVLHLVAVGYSATPTPSEKLGFRMFFDSLRYILPCPKCRASYEKYLFSRKLSEDDMSSRDKLFNWVYELHNSVNLNLKKAPFQTLEAVKATYYPLAIAAAPAIPPPPAQRASVVISRRSPSIFSQNMMAGLKLLKAPPPPPPPPPPPAKPAPPVLQAAWSPRSIPITHNRIVPMIHAVPAAPGTTRRSAPIPMAHAVPAAPGTPRRSAPMYSSGCGCRRR